MILPDFCYLDPFPELVIETDPDPEAWNEMDPTESGSETLVKENCNVFYKQIGKLYHLLF